MEIEKDEFDLLLKKTKAIEELHDRARDAYKEDQSRHAGQWRTGPISGLDEMMTYKRVLAILRATDSKSVENLRDMEDIELISFLKEYD